MSCGCNGINTPTTPSILPVGLECDYTIDQITVWKTLLNCISQIYINFDITSTQYNSYLGTVYSVTNYNNNPCYLRVELDKIQPLIVRIIDENIC